MRFGFGGSVVRWVSIVRITDRYADWRCRRRRRSSRSATQTERASPSRSEVGVLSCGHGCPLLPRNGVPERHAMVRKHALWHTGRHRVRCIPVCHNGCLSDHRSQRRGGTEWSGFSAGCRVRMLAGRVPDTLIFGDVRSRQTWETRQTKRSRPGPAAFGRNRKAAKHRRNQPASRNAERQRQRSTRTSARGRDGGAGKTENHRVGETQGRSARKRPAA